MCGHKETSCLPRQNHWSNSSKRLLMKSTGWKLLIFETKILPQCPERRGLSDVLPLFVMGELLLSMHVLFLPLLLQTSCFWPSSSLSGTNGAKMVVFGGDFGRDSLLFRAEIFPAGVESLKDTKLFFRLSGYWCRSWSALYLPKMHFVIQIILLPFLFFRT